MPQSITPETEFVVVFRAANGGWTAFGGRRIDTLSDAMEAGALAAVADDEGLVEWLSAQLGFGAHAPPRAAPAAPAPIVVPVSHIATATQLNTLCNAIAPFVAIGATAPEELGVDDAILVDWVGPEGQQLSVTVADFQILVEAFGPFVQYVAKDFDAEELPF